MRKTIYSLLILSVSSTFLYAQNKLKNLYIMVEPSLTMNNKIDGYEVNPVLDIRFNIIDDIIRWVSEDDIPKFRKVFVRGIDIDETVFFKDYDMSFKKLKYKIDALYDEVIGIKHYSVAKNLGMIAKDLKDNKMKAEDTLLVYIGDVNHDRNGFNSYGKALNSQWIENKRSPFVVDFIGNDNTYAKGLSVIVFNQTQLNILTEQLRESFLINLFSKAGMNVYYVGESYNNLETKIDKDASYVGRIIDQVRKKMRKSLNMRPMIATRECQYVGSSELTVPCGDK